MWSLPSHRLSLSLSLITAEHEPRVPPLNLRTVSSRLRPTLALSGKDMEEDSRPAPPDLAAGEACGNELTRTDSGSSSVTVDISKDFVRTKNVARPVHDSAFVFLVSFAIFL